ncbi:MAG: hypothetical protein AB7K24_27085 [Gemmataceae bacterium]
MDSTSINNWSREEREQLAVPEHDPDYLPPGMQPPPHWYTENGHYIGTTIVVPATLITE